MDLAFIRYLKVVVASSKMDGYIHHALLKNLYFAVINGHLKF